MKSKPKRIRLNMEFDPSTYSKMGAIMPRIHAASLTEVLRRSVEVYDFLTASVESGCKIVVIDSDGTKETLRIV